MTKHAKLMLEIFAAIEKGDAYERDVLNDPQEIWSQDMQEVLDALDAFADEQQPDKTSEPLGRWKAEAAALMADALDWDMQIAELRAG